MYSRDQLDAAFWLKRQPAGGCLVDPDLAPRGLRRALLFNGDPGFRDTLVNLPIDPASVVSGASIATTPRGYGILFDGTVNGRIGYNAENISTVSLEVLFFTGASTANVGIATWNDDSGGFSNTNDKGLYVNGSGGLTWYTYDGTPHEVTGGTTACAANTLFHLVGTNDGTTSRIYINGIDEGSIGSNGSYAAYVTPSLCLGKAVAGPNGFSHGSDITILYAGYANVAWTAGEVQRRYFDTFGMFVEQAPRWRVGSAAAAGTPPTPYHYRQHIARAA